MKIINNIKKWYRGEQLPPRRMFIDGEVYEAERHVFIRPPIIRVCIVLKFLLFQEKRYRTILAAITMPSIALVGYLFALDMKNISRTGTMSNETQWELRILGTIVIATIWLLSCLILTYVFYKKNKMRGGYSKEQIEGMQ